MFEHRFKELVNFARENSKFYRDFYSDIPINFSLLEEIPILNSFDFWKATTLDSNQIIANKMLDGIIFKSTQKENKYCFFSKTEWNLLTQIFARGIAAGPLRRGDRIANLFYIGDLFGPYFFFTHALEKSSIEVLQFPFSPDSSLPEIYNVLKTFSINVLAGTPETLLGIANYVKKTGAIKIDRILFGGENLSPNQIEDLMLTFPEAKIQSIGYANVEVGIIGYADQTCTLGEHRVFSEANYLEIIDRKTSHPIHEIGKPGMLVTTQLCRQLTPIIRYPIGEIAQWTEPSHVHDRKFKLMGQKISATYPRQSALN